MSYVFEVGEDTVWSPALRVGDLYVRYLREIAEMLGEPTGLTVASDMYEIDVDAHLVRKITDFYFSSSHPVLRGLIGGGARAVGGSPRTCGTAAQPSVGRGA